MTQLDANSTHRQTEPNSQWTKYKKSSLLLSFIFSPLMFLVSNVTWQLSKGVFVFLFCKWILAMLNLPIAVYGVIEWPITQLQLDCCYVIRQNGRCWLLQLAEAVSLWAPLMMEGCHFHPNSNRSFVRLSWASESYQYSIHIGSCLELHLWSSLFKPIPHYTIRHQFEPKSKLMILTNYHPPTLYIQSSGPIFFNIFVSRYIRNSDQSNLYYVKQSSHYTFG